MTPPRLTDEELAELGPRGPVPYYVRIDVIESLIAEVRHYRALLATPPPAAGRRRSLRRLMRTGLSAWRPSGSAMT